MLLAKVSIIMAKPVLIVGAGPVGLTMACELHRYGIPFRIIDKLEKPSEQSKALVVWPRTLELLSPLGVTKEFTNTGFYARGGHFYSQNKRLGTFEIRIDDSRFKQALMISQCQTESILTNYLRKNGIYIDRGVTWLEQQENNNRIQVKLQLKDGNIETADYEYVIACDGAHSPIRHHLGIEFAGEQDPHDWFLADVELLGLDDPSYLHLCLSSIGPVALFPFGKNHYRVIGDMGFAASSEKRKDPLQEEVQAILDERTILKCKIIKSIWLSSFRVHQRKVKKYRQGRCFLMGDAAHIHSPAGGQGMNTGMQDAINLAWKLAYVLRGYAPMEILDTFSVEREQIGQQILAMTGRVTKMMLLQNPILKRLRNTFLALMLSVPPITRLLARQMAQMRIAYSHSPLHQEGKGFFPNGIKLGERVPDGEMIFLSKSGVKQKIYLWDLLQNPSWKLIIWTDQAMMIDEANRFVNHFANLFRNQIQCIILLGGTEFSFDHSAVICLALDPEKIFGKKLGVTALSSVFLVRPDGYLSYRQQSFQISPTEAYLRKWLFPSCE